MKPLSFRRLSVITVLALAVLALPSCSPKGVKFEPYSAKAVQSAKSLSKPVVVHVGAEWCPACRKLESGALMDSKVRDALASFTRLEIDCTDKSNMQNREILGELEVNMIPVLLFRNGEGKEVQRLVGDQDPLAIIAAAKLAGGS